MAFVNSTRVSDASVFDRMVNLIAGIFAAIERRRVYAQTARELSALSTRELSDLGIARGMIAQISREAAYGK